jgi:succinoglycan biosynthesis transport protein ExoP
VVFNAPPPAQWGAVGADGAKPDTLQIIRVIARRSYLLILLFALLGAGAGAIYLYVVRPAYSAAATMMIDARRGGVQQTSVLGDQIPSDSSWIDSKIGVLNLEKDKIGQIVAPKIIGEVSKYPDFFSTAGRFDKLLSYISRVTGLKISPAAAPQLSDEEKIQWLANIIAGGIDVKRVGMSYLVSVNFSSSNQELTAKIANAVADAYVSAEMQAKEQDLRQASDWLQERYQALRDQAFDAERSVAEFKAKNNIVTSEGRPLNDQQLTQINGALAAAREKKAAAQAKLEQIKNVIAEQEKSGEIEATVSDALLNPIVVRLRGQYLDLLNKESDWSKRFGNNHLAVVAIRNQARDVRNSIHQELKNIGESYKSEYEIAQSTEAELQKQLGVSVAQIPSQAQISLRSLEDSAKSYRTFYDNFFLHYTESIQQQTSPIPEVRVISHTDSAWQSFPNQSRVMVLSALGGIALGAGLGFLRVKYDRALRSAPEVETLLRRECLAMVPRASSLERISARAVKFSRSSDNLFFTDAVSDKTIQQTPGAIGMLIEAPFSEFAESLRALKMSADIRGRPGTQIIGFTSSIPQEGKSTVAAAFAGIAGLVGSRVLLVDCDLRNPALSQHLAPEAEQGLLEVIGGQVSFDSVIWREPHSGVDFLPATNVRGLSYTAQVLRSEQIKELFETLRGSYDYIVVDLSPLVPVVDVRATTNLVDFYFFVVEWGRTPSELVQGALSSSREVYEKVLGFVLNKVSHRPALQYSGYYDNRYLRLTDSGRPVSAQSAGVAVE